MPEKEDRQGDGHGKVNAAAWRYLGAGSGSCGSCVTGSGARELVAEFALDNGSKSAGLAAWDRALVPSSELSTSGAVLVIGPRGGEAAGAGPWEELCACWHDHALQVRCHRPDGAGGRDVARHDP